MYNNKIMEKCKYCSHCRPDGLCVMLDSLSCEPAIAKMVEVQKERIKHSNTQNKNINIKKKNTNKNRF